MWVKYRPIKSPSNKNKKVKETYMTYGIKFYKLNACIKAQLKTAHLLSKSFNNEFILILKKCKSGLETKF